MQFAWVFRYKDNLFAVLNFEDALLFKEVIPKFGEDLKKAQYLIIPSKSYFTKEKNNLRLKFFQRVAIENNLDVIYSNFMELKILQFMMGVAFLLIVLAR